MLIIKTKTKGILIDYAPLNAIDIFTPNDA